jgi:TDG/mug DNA glycosylase family protein
MELLDRLQRCRPRSICFQGITGYRPFAAAIGAAPVIALGPQPLSIGDARVFVVPSPSPRNARVTPEEQTAWYNRVAIWLWNASGEDPVQA